MYNDEGMTQMVCEVKVNGLKLVAVEHIFALMNATQTIPAIKIGYETVNGSMRMSCSEKQLQTTYTNVGWPVFGIFDKLIMLCGRASANVKFAFNAGSSKQGSARLASVGWNWVTATHLLEIRTTMNEREAETRMLHDFHLVSFPILYELR